jgi:hypothetical protein
MADVELPAPRAHSQDLVFALEVRRIQGSPNVEAGTLEFGVDADGFERVTFDLATEPTIEPARFDVRDVERINFVYGPGRRFGETAPTWITCDREDFPRNIGHLCAGPPGCPAVPCLALGGMQPLYERGGIEVLMDRLREFMRDAKTGTLMAEGWEPVPFPVEQTFQFGEIEPRFFQEHAHAHPTDRYALGVAINTDLGEQVHVNLFPEIIPSELIREAIGSRNGGDGVNREFRGIPWIFLWRDTDQVETDPIFQAWRTQGELRQGLRRLGIESAFDVALGLLKTNGVDFRVKRPPYGGTSFAVILGVWRSAPIMDDFFGYSFDDGARRLELRSYLVRQEFGKEIMDDDATVDAVIGAYPPRPELMRWVAGVDAFPPFALFGYGALGSAIYNNLVRSGADDALVQDKDRLLVHNFARHTGSIGDAHHLKVEEAKQLMDGVVQGGSAKLTTFDEDIVSLPLDVLVQRIDGRLVIDATADELVRKKLDDARSAASVTIVRTEMFHDGRLGVTFVTPPDGPALSELMLSLIAAAPHHTTIAAWLEHEARYPLGPKPMLYGFGCTSQTVHLPNHVVQLQAAAATSVLLDRRFEAGILINPLDGNYLPTGAKWIDAPSFESFIPPTVADWTVRISSRAKETMTAERGAALPAETGGYLYGAWDPVAKQITVVVATAMPPDSTADATTLELGPAKGTIEERRLVRKTCGQLYLCGTWHSHVTGGARMSGKDHRAMEQHCEKDARSLRPTLMVIIAAEEMQAHLSVPQ